MSESESLAFIASEWVTKAESDLKTASHTLELERGCPTDAVCFHVQQCVEKYIEPYLAFRRVDFPKVHDVEKLISLLPPEARPSLSADEQARLTQYAVRPRYPGWTELGPAPHV